MGHKPQMETVFQQEITPANALDVIKEFINKLNELVEEATSREEQPAQKPFKFEGGIIGYNDGGKTNSSFKGLDLKKYQAVKVDGSLLNSPRELSFMAHHVALFGLLSYGVATIKIQVGRGNTENGLMIGIRQL